jgi:hypothetical protein
MARNVNNSGSKKAAQGRPKEDAGVRGKAAGPAAADLWEKFWQQAWPLVESKVAREVTGWLHDQDLTIEGHKKAFLEIQRFQNEETKPRIDALLTKVATIDEVQDGDLEALAEVKDELKDLTERVDWLDKLEYQLNWSPNEKMCMRINDLEKRADAQADLINVARARAAEARDRADLALDLCLSRNVVP